MSFQKRLSAGKFVVLAELNTPKGVNISELVTNARRIRGRIDAAVIPDMDNGVMRMSALAGGALMQQNGIEPIIHVYGRDRNRMALQGDILGAYVLGIPNLVVVEGEPMNAGDHVDARTVDDLDELGLIRVIHSLEKGSDMAGFELNGTPSFCIGCAIPAWPDEDKLEGEIEKIRKMVEEGASFVLAPAVFDLEWFSSFLNKVKDLKVPIIPSVFLLKTVGIARYMATYEPGARISEDLIKRMRGADDREREGILIAGETIKGLKDMAKGVRIITLGWEHRLPEILDAAGL
ncbi:MAG: methylenetetrahydrofolate reductase [Deltaproteobacteria bacterium]|nr:methylenetetrahydrofolate reductase [Deltaproteobacteria bacterium]MBW2017094.1 methylenetetrahydrofolate reductase [Deltaproteobacteria bacterium]